MPNRENHHLHTLESNSYMYCPHSFLLARTYKWLCTNLETVSSRELKLLTSTLLSYAKAVNLTPQIKKYYLKLFKHCKSNQLRRGALRKPDKTLQNLIDIGQAMKVANSQAQAIEEQCEKAAVNQVNKQRWRVKFGNRHRGRSNGQH